jgi:hypothetical protein
MTLVSFFKENVVRLNIKWSLYSDPRQTVCMINKVFESLLSEGTEAEKLNKKAECVLAIPVKRHQSFL